MSGVKPKTLLEVEQTENILSNYKRPTNKFIKQSSHQKSQPKYVSLSRRTKLKLPAKKLKIKK